jgi:hypothetical protein
MTTASTGTPWITVGDAKTHQRKRPIAGGPTREAVRSLQSAVSRTIGDLSRYESLNDYDQSRAMQAKLAEIQRLALELSDLAEGRVP